MIGDLLLKLNALLSRQKIFFYTGLSIFILFLLVGISRLRVTESIFATLPKGKTFEEFNKLVENRNIINQVVFSIDIPEETTTQDAAFLAESFADSLRNRGKGLVKDIQETRPDVQENVYNYVYTRFPQLIDTSYYDYIRQRIAPDTIRKSVASAYNQLLTPGGSFLKQFIVNDPIGITTGYLKSLNTNNNTNGLLIEDGVMFSGDRRKIIVMAQTSFDSGNSARNVALFEKMEAFRLTWNERLPQNKFSYFGTFEIAARNAIQVKNDTFTTMIVAVVAILVLLVFYYRKVTVPLFMLLPGLFGGIFATGIIGYVHPEVSGISLATGAVIFGILLDYSFHFFTHIRHTGSVATAVRDVSGPLLTGSFTTVMAFTALTFANSVFLQDFGLVASLSLLGAALFTLIALPVILQSLSFDYKKIPAESKIFNLPSISFKMRSRIFWATMGLTCVFLFFANDTSFDSNLDNLSISDPELQQRETELTGLDPRKEKRIYVFATDRQRAKAELINDQIYRKLVALKGRSAISGFVSPGAFMVPAQLKQTRLKAWTSYWTRTKTDSVFKALDVAAVEKGFNRSAFDKFKRWISQENDVYVAEDELFKELGLRNLVDSRGSGTTLISTVTVPQKQLQAVKVELRKIPGAEVFDRGELAGELLEQVKDDFNFLLLITASIVFVTLLVVYGRIELTLLSFLPMVISWIWILGIAAILGIQFNFVNVIITTFIFGLGDDFSIFVTDGLLSKYRDNRDTLRSYQSAIILSALTTILGTGVLIFAKHPAIHSVALISVLGIVCILFISFIIQPVLFDFFVQKRIERKKAPVTFLPFLISVSSFTYFLSGCLFLHSKLVTILLLPVSKKRKRALINNSLSFYAKTVIYSGPHVRKNISGRENLDMDKPVIFIANHTSFLDILLTIMLNPKIVLMVKGWVYNSPFFGPIIRYAGYVYSEDGPEANIERVRELVADGYSLLIFPEGTRSEDGRITRFHKGAFHLAAELGMDIQPILIHGASEVLPKNDFLIKPGALNVRVLPRIQFNNQERWGTTLRDQTRNVSQFFKQQFDQYRQEMENADYLKHRIFTNYVFKGPVLEWYFKVKWRLEAKNFEFYDQLVGDRTNILDVGCGYGYLSFFLHYRSEKRKILGVDYDDDKIRIAQNSYHKTDQLQFVSDDIMQVHPGHQDVIFLNDVLHYLSADKQRGLLASCAVALNPDGILLIRDGITDLNDRHKNTERTEQLSTGLFSFNKKTDAFHFFSSADIRKFAEKYHLSCEIIEHSKSTSNVLFILRKQPQPVYQTKH